MISKKLFLDIGSSTVKAYTLSPTGLKPLTALSIPFKQDFDSRKGISPLNKDKLFKFINQLQEQNPRASIKIFATAVFRKLSPRARLAFGDEFFQKTRLYFNIIDQTLENYYLELALTGKYRLDQPALFINIGGGSTELVVVRAGKTVKRVNLDLGVGAILSNFPQINQPASGISLSDILRFSKKLLPPLPQKTKIAFYTGGELTYMRLAGYRLRPNKLFKDADHPFIIKYQDFSAGNKNIFEKITLNQLELLMPENPGWMRGARACSAIAQAICRQYQIQTIIPSDSNLVHGAVRREFRKAVISGSFRKHLKEILSLKKKFEKNGVKVLSPRFEQAKNPGQEFVVFTGEEHLSPLALERHHLNSIAKSDVLIVCDPQGYVGASALLEIGFAQALRKKVIFTQKPQEFMLNTLPAQIGL